MSASERLKARLWPVWDVEPLSVAERQAVVAVVEAVGQAERYDYCEPDDGDGICSDPNGRWAEWQDIGAALAALDEALGGDVT